MPEDSALLTNNGSSGEYFPHPNGFIIGVPIGEIPKKANISRIIKRIYERFGCLLISEEINGKQIILPYAGLPTAKEVCRIMLKWLCEDLGLCKLELSGDLVNYDTSGKLQEMFGGRNNFMMTH